MRDLTDGADRLTTELFNLLHLCEWIDRQNDEELAAVLPALHGEMHAELDILDAALASRPPAAPTHAVGHGCPCRPFGQTCRRRSTFRPLFKPIERTRHCS